ncbi:MAG: hypothetical protein OHK0052_18440 [Anaerolineales bacterium]
MHEREIRFCMIDGQAVNAYAKPLVSLDLDLAVAVESLDDLEIQLAQHFTVNRFPGIVSVAMVGALGAALVFSGL